MQNHQNDETSSVISDNKKNTVYKKVDLVHMFTAEKFRIHRITGAFYLLYYAYLWVWFIFDIESYVTSTYTIILPALGVFQTIVAMRTFTFLSKNKDNSGKQGYFSDKNTISYDFVCENVFFAGILLFQWMYYSPNITFPLILENIFVFLPYVVLRPFTPKTSFRSSNENMNEKTIVNRNFMLYATNITKIFYVFAKHHLGFYLNYLMFLGLVTDLDRYYVYLMLLFGAFSTTIAVFLHTLKFKKYISSRTSIIIYIASYLCTIYSLVKILLLANNMNLEYIILGGVAINFLPLFYQNTYQILVMLYFNMIRYNYVSDAYNILKLEL